MNAPGGASVLAQKTMKKPKALGIIAGKVAMQSCLKILDSGSRLANASLPGMTEILLRTSGSGH